MAVGTMSENMYDQEHHVDEHVDDNDVDHEELEEESRKLETDDVTVSTRRAPGFYTSLAAVRMRSRETINIVGSFAAIAQAVQVAETLKSRGDAVITKIETGYGPSAGFAKGVPAQKPEIHITVKRTPEFESKMAEVEKKLLQQAEEEKLRQQANE